MAHIPNNPQVAKISLVGHRDTRQWVNVFHAYKASGPVILLDLINLANAYKAAWDAAYKTAMPGAIVLDQIQCRKLDPTNPLAYDSTTGLPSAGTRTDVPEAANVTLTISWRTGLAGRKYRGRNYIAGIGENATTILDYITPAFLSIVSALADNLYNAPINAGGFVPAVFHLGPDTITAIQSWVIDAILDSQRRRLPARGR
jgi:hypothetical protein